MEGDARLEFEFDLPADEFGDFDEGMRQVTIIQPIESAVPLSVAIDYGDGNEPEELEIRAGDHEYPITRDYAIGAVPIIVISFPGCPDQTIEIGQVADCPPPPPVVPPPNTGGNGGGGFSWGDLGCLIGRWTMVISGALALVAVLLITCFPGAAVALGNIALAAGAVSLIAGVLWGALCPIPCNWGLLLGWQVLLTAGLISIHFVACCPVLFWSGLAAIGTAIGLSFAWRTRCNISPCSLIGEYTALFVSVVAPVMNLLDFRPLSPCINPIVEIILQVIAGILGLVTLACLARLAANQQP